MIWYKPQLCYFALLMDMFHTQKIGKIKFCKSSVFLFSSVFWTELRYKVVTPKLVKFLIYCYFRVFIISSELPLLPIVFSTSSFSAPTDIYKPVFSGQPLGQLLVPPFWVFPLPSMHVLCRAFTVGMFTEESQLMGQGEKHTDQKWSYRVMPSIGLGDG